MSLIGAEEAKKRLGALEGWELAETAIRRQFSFASFPEAVAFVLRVAFAAEAADHHPDILVSYRKVTLTFSTHSAGGLTGKDFEGAAVASEIAAGTTGR